MTPSEPEQQNAIGDEDTDVAAWSEAIGLRDDLWFAVAIEIDEFNSNFCGEGSYLIVRQDFHHALSFSVAAPRHSPAPSSLQRKG